MKQQLKFGDFQPNETDLFVKMAERELMCLVTCATVVTGNGGTQWQWPAAYRHLPAPISCRRVCQFPFPHSVHYWNLDGR
ncbi:hypothetical protein J6590_011130, partial [Homalodisca vitripennis]